MKISGLRVGDRVTDREGMRGTVVGFTRDRVAIEWSDAAGKYTDADLAAMGVAKVSAFVAEDTRPE